VTPAVPELCDRVAARLGQIEGVTAVVLGGSWARGDAHPDSDLDLGIYYDPASPPSFDALRLLACDLDDRHLPDLVTDLGEWGPWINGGGWLQIEDRRVDWLYRDLARVSHVIDECRAGRPTCDYQPGHPHGFHSHIYLAEIHACVPLFDPQATLPPLKARTTPYPPALRAILVKWYLWEAASRSIPAGSRRSEAISSTSPAACSAASPVWCRCSSR
jgi:predicted nucleotidyltransferase